MPSVSSACPALGTLHVRPVRRVRPVRPAGRARSGGSPCARRRRSGVGDCGSDPAREDAPVRLRPEPRPASGPSGAPSSAQSGARRPAPRPGPGRRARIGCPSFGPRTEETRRGSPPIVRIRRRGAAVPRPAPRRRFIPGALFPQDGERRLGRDEIGDMRAAREETPQILRDREQGLGLGRALRAGPGLPLGHVVAADRLRHPLRALGRPLDDERVAPRQQRRDVPRDRIRQGGALREPRASASGSGKSSRRSGSQSAETSARAATRPARRASAAATRAPVRSVSVCMGWSPSRNDGPR